MGWLPYVTGALGGIGGVFAGGIGAPVGAAAGYAAGAGIENLLSGKKKKTNQQTSAFQVPQTNLRDFESGQLSFAELKNRLAGRGVGFRPEVLSAATNPFAAQRRANLQQQTLPTISSQASARGLGKSTIPIGQAAQASQGVEREIGQRIADLQLANEQQRRTEINAALSGLQSFAGSQANLKLGVGSQQQQAQQFAQSLDFQQQQLAQQQQNALLGGAAGLGIGGLQAFTAQQTNKTLIDAILKSQGAVAPLE